MQVIRTQRDKSGVIGILAQTDRGKILGLGQTQKAAERHIHSQYRVVKT